MRSQLQHMHSIPHGSYQPLCHSQLRCRTVTPTAVHFSNQELLPAEAFWWAMALLFPESTPSPQLCRSVSHLLGGAASSQTTPILL